MSQGNTSIGESDSASLPFVAMMKSGAAFSGRERHCGFLNQQDGTFATVSAISGLDLPDDGRAAARVDWDGDGDLDLWISNRSGPQIRYFRNDLAGRNRYLTVRLEGRTCNRDAVGSRLELYLKGRTAPLVRTLRAGEGFLAQSSKVIHFGLGPTPEIERLVVRWPDGVTEEIRGLKIDRPYHLVQGSGLAELLTARQAPPLEESDPVEAGDSRIAHVLSQALTPVPALTYRDWKGTELPVFTGNPRQPGQPVLLNLWASWCAPCVTELAEFGKEAAALRSAGVQVVALSVDGVGTTGDLAAAERLVGKLGLPFATGIADSRLVEKLQLVHDITFELHQELPVPTSILIDGQGNMSAIHKGPVSVKRVLEDVARIGLDSDRRRAASLPFDGRWFAPARPLNLFNLAWQLFERGFFDEGIVFYVNHASRIKGHPNHPKLLVLIGDGCARDRRWQLASRMFAEALTEQPEWDEAHERLARILASCPDPKLRAGAEAVRLAQRAVQLGGGRDARTIDTLAAAYAEAGQFDKAVEAARKALELARTGTDAAQVAEIETRLHLYESGSPFHEQ